VSQRVEINCLYWVTEPDERTFLICQQQDIFKSALHPEYSFDTCAPNGLQILRPCSAEIRVQVDTSLIRVQITGLKINFLFDLQGSGAHALARFPNDLADIIAESPRHKNPAGGGHSG
jgi:hypothetical protein